MKRKQLSIMKSSAVAIITGALVLLGAPGCSNETGATDKDEHSGHEHHDEEEDIEVSETQLSTVGITLGHIEVRELGTGILATGTVEVDPSAIAEISPIIPGLVRSIDVREGRHVGAGTVVATVDNPELLILQKDYRNAHETLKLAASEKERQETLAREGAGIRKNLEKALSDYSVARAEMEALADRLRNAGIDPEAALKGSYRTTAPVRTPISGVVGKIYKTTGSYADMTSPIMTVINPSGTYVALRLYENDLARVKEGRQVEMSLTNGSATFTGEVESIGSVMESDTRGYTARIRISSAPDSPLLPGMAVTGIISSGLESVETLPEDAIARMGDKDVIFVLEEKEKEGDKMMYRFSPVVVNTGSREAGYVAVYPVSPVKKDAVVVVSKAFYLASMASDHGEHNH